MKLRSWSFFVASRWLIASRSDGRMTSNILSSFGIALGVATLIVVIGVMNGFQSGFIDAVLSVDSHHARLHVAEKTTATEMEALVKQLESIQIVSSVLPFFDIDTVLYKNARRLVPARLKAVPGDVDRRDSLFVKELGLAGKLRDAPLGSAILGSELACSLGVSIGDTISVFSVSASKEEGLQSNEKPLLVSDIFKSGYYDFDASLAIVSLETGFEIKSDASPILGVKYINKYANGDALRKTCETNGIAIDMWSDFNRSFFGALRTEKSAMMMLVGLIFVVVGLNIYHAMKRSVFERMEAIAVLKAIGAEADALRSVFIMDGLLIGIAGALFGLGMGLFISNNINGVIRFFETTVNTLGVFIERMLGSRSESQSISIYSPSVFYLVDIPVKTYWYDIVLIFFCGAGSAIAAAFFASSRVMLYKPAEVLRNE